VLSTNLELGLNGLVRLNPRTIMVNRSRGFDDSTFKFSHPLSASLVTTSKQASLVP